MCFPTFTALGSLLLLFSFILELFIIIAQLSNRQFLNIIYFVSAWNQDRQYNVALWNYCQGTPGGGIQSCASPRPAFNWAQTPEISSIATRQANSTLVDGLFLGMFILFFIGMGLSFIFWLMSIPICCLKRRAWGYSMSTLVFINFLVMLAALILALVLVLGGIKSFTGGTSPWNAQAGNALWITIGAVVSLFLAFLCYSSGSCCGGSKRKRRDNYYNDAEADHGRRRAGCCGCGRGRRKNKAKIEPEYKNNYIPGTTQPMYAHSPMFQNKHTPQNQADTLQQPYVMDQQRTGTSGINNNVQRQDYDLNYTGGQPYSSNLTNQQGYDTQQGYNTHGYDKTTGMSYDPNATSGMGDTAVGTGQQNYGPNDANNGYQTPILEPANQH